MQKIKDNELKDIKEVAASGTLLNRIGSIVGKVGDFVIDVAMHPFAYIEAAKGHDKAKFKIGGSSFEFDDTTSVKLTASNNISENVVKLETMRSFDNSLMNTGNGLDTTKALNANVDANVVKDLVFNKYFG
ncbi:hypothetical protein [Mesoplasma melaleucae]|uniref:Uncharacterized protein n=1 Tax=Mesoplasma melaleucae TaxID=81459 RepID=A0A2K8NWL5_9MOLU|nr:hypothetical protein [Mesoplasma melaleucae]ATZ18124.1 hypothetical protein EMELA_v1c06110 [Mesoplasma melaleucae]